VIAVRLGFAQPVLSFSECVSEPVGRATRKYKGSCEPGRRGWV
jgi:hypothetical protein